jgi:hypothetical protein
MYDPTKRTIHVSRNMTLNENEEPHELQIITDLPGLQLEGEQVTDDNLSNPVTPEPPEHREPGLETRTTSVTQPASQTYLPRSTRRTNINYHTLGNPNT